MQVAPHQCVERLATVQSTPQRRHPVWVSFDYHLRRVDKHEHEQSTREREHGQEHEMADELDGSDQ